MILADSVQYTPVLFAALAGWIMCVCLHEFSHALVAYWGGDHTVKEKGYLSVDPTRFIDPVFTLLIPAVILLMGGFPFPGASVRIDESRLRSAKWATAVSAAGPASNAIIFLLLCIPLHPVFGLVAEEAADRPMWVHYLGAMATFNFIATLFNLLPVPPLDGFGMIEPKLSYETRLKFRQPSVTWAMFIGLMLVINSVPAVIQFFLTTLVQVCDMIGVNPFTLLEGYWLVLYGESL